MAFLPLAVLLGLILTLGNLNPEKGWRVAILRAAVLWGTYLVVLTELLSLVEIVTSLGLTIGWLTPLLAIAAFFVIRIRRGHSIILPRPIVAQDWFNRLLLIGVLVIIVSTGILAWFAPPQTWDSLNYHMPRVAHWAQERAVRHFVTGIEPQNYMPPGAEYMILHLYVLTAGDRLSNFVEWFAMIGSLIGVSWIYLLLGGEKGKQLIAVLFAATLPMGIVQASSTMTDYVVAFWMVVVAAESIALAKGEEDRGTVPILALSAGLAVFTKPTGIAYALPFAVLVAVILVRRYRLLHFLRYTVVAIALVLMLNFGHFVRNYATYGNPFGSERRISSLITEEISIPIIISNTLRNASLHAGTPSPHVNKGIYLTVVKVHEIIGIDPKDSRTTHSRKYRVFPPSTHEDLTTNVVHAYLYLITFVILLVRRRRYSRDALVYGLIVPCSFIFVSTLPQWQLWNGRLHLGFFVLYAPLAAYVVSDVLPPRMLIASSVLIFTASLPWLFQIRSRPLIYNPNTSYTKVVYRLARWEQYFVNGGHLKRPHTEVTRRILDSGCKEVGIALPGNEAEYPLWVLLNAPFSDIKIEWIIGGTSIALQEDHNENLCAILLNPCSEDQFEFRDLPLVYRHRATEFCLFLGE